MAGLPIRFTQAPLCRVKGNHLDAVGPRDDWIAPIAHCRHSPGVHDITVEVAHGSVPSRAERDGDALRLGSSEVAGHAAYVQRSVAKHPPVKVLARASHWRPYQGNIACALHRDGGRSVAPRRSEYSVGCRLVYTI